LLVVDKKNHHRQGHAENAGMAQEIDEALVETAKEADRQKKFVERQSDNLRHRLQNVSRESHALARHRLNENSNLLFECNDLRMEAKELNRKLSIRRNELDVAQRTIKELKNQIAALARTNSADSTHRPTRVKPVAATQAATMSSTLPNPEAVDLPESRYPAQWVVHNALIAANETQPQASAEPQLAPIRGKPLPVPERKMHKSAVSQSAPALNDGSAAPAKPLATTLSTADMPGLGVGMTKQLTLNVPRTADLVVNPLKLGSRKVSSVGATGAEWQVEKLSKEVANLASQLDDTLREKEVQRLELNRLRKQLMSTSALSNAPGAQMGVLPSLARSTISQDGEDGRQLSSADLYGMPSEADKESMQFRPSSSSLGVAPAVARNPTQNAYLSNPNILAAKAGSGRVRTLLTFTLQLHVLEITQLQVLTPCSCWYCNPFRWRCLPSDSRRTPPARARIARQVVRPSPPPARPSRLSALAARAARVAGIWASCLRCHCSRRSRRRRTQSASLHRR
jgi:regulator of replication initiation timing